jgi:FkbM family methyltransferase
MQYFFPPDVEARLTQDFFGSGAKGFFVEVGANHPQHGSQSWPLEQAGWSGIVIEPLPDLAAMLRRERSAQVFAVACSSTANAGRTMTLHIAGRHGIGASLNPDLAIADMRADETIAVPVRTLDDILTEARAPAPIDFLSIDVEGHEIDVLDGFTLSRWQPRLLLIEDHIASLHVHHYLTRHGYRWIRRTGLNGWYVPDKSTEQVGFAGRLQFFRKYYLGMPFRRMRDAIRRRRRVERG